MIKLRYLLLFLEAALLPLLFGSLPFGSPEPARARAAISSQNQLGFTHLITFTPVATVYLPIVIKPLNNLKITRLVFDSSDEIVEIKNNGPGSQSLTGWVIVSVVGPQTYNFPAITLAAGSIVRVHSGSGAINNPPADLFWTDAFIWNNDGDKAELRDPQNNLQASFCYGSGCP